MADEKAKTGLAAGAGGAIGAALAIMASRRAEAAPPIDEAVLKFLESIAESGVSIDENVEKILAALGIIVLKNPPEITCFRILVPVVNTPVQLPDREIPYDKELVIKAVPTNLGLIYVANSRAEALNLNSSYWLLANEAIEYKVENADRIWINATRAGEGVLCTSEWEGGR